MIYRKVMCSDRLPELEGPYDTNCGRLHFVPKIDMFDTSIVEWWYEPIELPSEWDIEKLADDNGCWGVEASWWKFGFRKAIELIKGGTK